MEVTDWHLRRARHVPGSRSSNVGRNTARRRREPSTCTNVTFHSINERLLGWSQEELARQAGVAVTTVRDVEAEKRGATVAAGEVVQA